MKKSIYIALITILFGCETTITPYLNEAEELMVVDAWINQKMERQEIRITRSQPYFDNSIPIKISNATVRVEDLNTGIIYDFQEGTTSYFWDPIGTPIGVVGNNYRLTVTLAGETFEAYSNLGRVPPVDSIKFHYKPEDFLVKEEYYTAELVASDPVGVGDTYWIKAWKNGEFLNKPAELNVTFDAGFSSGQPVDGQVFIIPIRIGFLNILDADPAKKGEFLPPYLVGDSLQIEIHSINPLAFDFLYGVYFLTNRPGGFAELFSTPLSNSTTNLVSTDNSSTTNIAGFFNVAAVSQRGRRLTQAMADEAKLAGE